jgi:hypothetical protein
LDNDICFDVVVIGLSRSVFVVVVVVGTDILIAPVLFSNLGLDAFCVERDTERERASEMSKNSVGDLHASVPSRIAR